MPSKSKVCFFFDNVSAPLRDRNHLKRHIEAIFSTEMKELESITYIFCSDKALLKINQRYLQHDYYTDIVTFNLSEGKPIRGEIYISTDRVKDNAKQLHVSGRNELHRVIFHGALHLCGYKDKTKKDQKLMREKEDLYLLRLAGTK